ncbi:MAG: 23S rRNA (pseudouridine(1915)-N(3))-methyltransferase RlmH [Bacteroidales bacterium]|nr:23S rRNA (pseudouridine(1915)-N(3))-methyltransferase RlmH [Bacteroidales bacterium]MBO5718953.1 23S rRNA (pseudouridine(1915)-N(3))-methyltransferase RlmH [Bacteroidales bacterium]MBO5768956.1 23S rRNA (pseudouridine(1915)-N(3))-methyltransferase RlmH [Bacteroidales bacterium]MBO5818613.1 23S rRNA (pseudouridine(1915)-N(3))-methyltransferase RlmH [Bacteroidales bacterium]MBO5834968.1 23S rRNA (pseudouridine(1915)-N(3))-methyltransferase RlmH [Bacteroidales bacterium]
MKVILLQVGKTTDKYAIQAIEEYASRLKHYVSFQIESIPDLKSTKNLTEAQVKAREAEQILAWHKPENQLVLLDERGLEQSSMHFAQWMQKKMNSGLRQLVFVIGGPYGFDQRVYDAVKERISLSKMTFSHQMVRVFFVEQLYRAMTILNGEPYHHE